MSRKNYYPSGQSNPAARALASKKRNDSAQHFQEMRDKKQSIVDMVKNRFSSTCCMCGKTGAQTAIHQYGDDRRCIECIPQEDRLAVLEGTYAPKPVEVPQDFGGWS